MLQNLIYTACAAGLVIVIPKFYKWWFSHGTLQKKKYQKLDEPSVSKESNNNKSDHSAEKDLQDEKMPALESPKDFGLSIENADLTPTIQHKPAPTSVETTFKPVNETLAVNDKVVATSDPENVTHDVNDNFDSASDGENITLDDQNNDAPTPTSEVDVLDLYAKQIEQNPNELKYYISRSQIYIQRGLISAAIQDHKEIIRLNPDNAHSLFEMGALQTKTNDLQGAIDSYNQAHKLDPKNPEYFYQSGIRNYRLKEYSSAIEDFEQTRNMDCFYKHTDYYLKFAKEKKWEVSTYKQMGEKIVENFKHIESAEGKNGVLFVGPSGAGKSTLVNYLKGAKLKLKKLNVTHVLYVDGEEHTKIGHDPQSETTYPIVISASDSDSDSDLTYLDCPGFLDTRGDAAKIAAALHTRMTIEYLNKIQCVVLTIPYSDLADNRLNGLRNLLDVLIMFFEISDRLSKSIIITITKKTMGVTPDDIKLSLNNAFDLLLQSITKIFVKQRDYMPRAKKIEERVACFRECEELSKKIRMLNILKNCKVFIPDYLDQGESRNELLNHFPNTEPLNKSNFTMVMDARSERLFKKRFMEETAEQGIRLIDRANILSYRKKELETQVSGDKINELIDFLRKEQKSVLEAIKCFKSDEIETIELSTKVQQCDWCSYAEIIYDGDVFDNKKTIYCEGSKLVVEKDSPDNTSFIGGYFFKEHCTENVKIQFQINRKNKKETLYEIKTYEDEYAYLEKRIQILTQQQVEQEGGTASEQNHEVILKNAITKLQQAHQSVMEKIKEMMPTFHTLIRIMRFYPLKSPLHEEFYAKYLLMPKSKYLLSPKAPVTNSPVLKSPSLKWNFSEQHIADLKDIEDTTPKNDLDLSPSNIKQRSLSFSK